MVTGVLADDGVDGRPARSLAQRRDRTVGEKGLGLWRAKQKKKAEESLGVFLGVCF